MPSMKIFDIAGSAMAAQSVRLNTVASNLANAGNVTGDPQAVYKPVEPVFSSQVLNATQPGLAGVRVERIEQGQAEPLKRYEPGNPLADPQGYVYAPDIDPVAQMVNMISAARAYQADVEMLNTGKELALATLNLGR
ncbi:flagellar basal body rod protein FlgC [uncultured Aquimonas sp.]|uniref:flagellar basal body rod protein FlgC n=1 Tax=uncultured Aquimonas sp. TaxID=385483 RepID=UPI0008686BDC|nr:flagellar basal body rod protein FlgC [uncultured Aquimonas sp.]ODU47894.1 MAG: flagellar basal body rod protein FlgC [Xanthomonadaceae bacterium SCN 69-123]